MSIATEAMEERYDALLDQAYAERNKLVAFLARCYPSGTRKTAIEGWDPQWNGCVFIDAPAGQMSWHYHEREAHLFARLPPYEKPWDGHTTPEKYERLALASRDQGVQGSEIDKLLRRWEGLIRTGGYRETPRATMRQCAADLQGVLAGVPVEHLDDERP